MTLLLAKCTTVSLLAAAIGMTSTATLGQQSVTPAPGESFCRWQPPAWGNGADVVCPLPSRGDVRRFRVAALFLGSHDDTRISIRVSQRGADLGCRPGDKAVSSGEEGNGGEVLLACRFEPRLEGSERADIVVHVAWSHAQPAGFVLTSDP